MPTSTELDTETKIIEDTNKSKPEKVPIPKKLKMADLFAGTGAFSLAFTETGKVKVVYANDYFVGSKQIYDANFSKKSHSLNFGDLNNVDVGDIPRIDILTGGFPCQPFSIAGKQNGFKDVRSNVFWKILEIMKTRKPRFVVLENVKNLKNHDKGKTYTTICSELNKIGYHVKSKILNTCVYTGIPQNRERIYIIAFARKSDFKKFEFPTVLDGSNSQPPIQRQNISQFLESGTIPSKYYYSKESAIWDTLKESVTENVSKNIVYQYRRYYVRRNMNELCPTLTANMGSGGHNVPIIRDNMGIRKLTPRECFNLQGFPPSYKLPDNMSNARLYQLAGNAVSVPIVKLIAESLVKL